MGTKYHYIKHTSAKVEVVNIRDEALEASYTWRGKVIEYTAQVEKHLDQIICKHFISKLPVKREEFMNVILSKEYFGFSAKCELLMYVISQTDKELYNANTNEEGETKPTFNSRLKKIKDFRNDVAHRIIDNQSLSDGINGVKIQKRNPKKLGHVNINEKKVQDHIDQCKAIIGELIEYQRITWGDKKPK